jgi:hypothetical protein
MAGKIITRLALAAFLLWVIFGVGMQWASIANSIAGTQGAIGRPPTTAEISALSERTSASSLPGVALASPLSVEATDAELAAMLAAELLLLEGSTSLVNLPYVVK